LKAMRLGQADAQCLCDYLAHRVHPAERVSAAQILGFHGATARYPEVRVAVMRWAEKEDDPIALRAMVFALRNTEGVLRYLMHERLEIVLESVVGIPADAAAHRALIAALFACGSECVARGMCLQISRWETAVPEVIAFLMTAEFATGGTRFDDRVRMIFGVLSQLPLLDCLLDQSGEIQRNYNDIWPGIWRRERQRHLWDLFAQVVAQDGAADDLVVGMVKRVVEDEPFYLRYARHIRTLLKALDVDALMLFQRTCSDLGQTIDRAVLGRLAEMLIALVRAHPETGKSVQHILGEWEALLPGARLQAFHAMR